jgi:predicted acyltransferase
VVGRTIGLIKVAMPDGTELPLQAYIFQAYYLSIASPINASLLYAISFILVMFLVVWFMWKKKWFLKV